MYVYIYLYQYMYVYMYVCIVQQTDSQCIYLSFNLTIFLFYYSGCQ